jgi:hypothetical protein
MSLPVHPWATGMSALWVEAAISTQFYCRRTAVPLGVVCISPFANCQFFGGWGTLSSGAGFQAEQILLMLFLESRS